MFMGPQETVRDNKSSSYPVFQLPGVNCIYHNNNKISNSMKNNDGFYDNAYNNYYSNYRFAVIMVLWLY